MISKEFDSWDRLVIEFRSGSLSRRQKNIVYKKLRAYYLPKLRSIKASFPSMYHDEIESIYDKHLLNCIGRWTGQNKDGKLCHFMTYFGYYVMRKVESEIYEQHKKKIDRDRKIGLNASELLLHI